MQREDLIVGKKYITHTNTVMEKHWRYFNNGKCHY